MLALILMIGLFGAGSAAQVNRSSGLGAAPMRGYVLLQDQSQRRASGIEVRLVRAFPERWLYSVKTEGDGRFSFPDTASAEITGRQIPGALDTVYFYINIEGYAPVMQIAKPGLTILVVSRGATETLLPTDYEPPPLTRLEALRDELVKMYSEPAVREYEAGLKDTLKGKQDTAITHYEKSVKIAPQFFDAMLQLGFAHQELKQNADAERAFRRTVEARPTSGDALTALGGILLEKPDYDEAVKVLKNAVSRAPWSSEAQYFLGSASFKLVKYDEAEVALREAFTLSRPRHEARLMLVNILIKQRRYPEALEQLNEYLKAVPDSPQRESVEKMRTQIQDALKPPGF